MDIADKHAAAETTQHITNSDAQKREEVLPCAQSAGLPCGSDAQASGVHLFPIGTPQTSEQASESVARFFAAAVD